MGENAHSQGPTWTDLGEDKGSSAAAGVLPMWLQLPPESWEPADSSAVPDLAV